MVAMANDINCNFIRLKNYKFKNNGRPQRFRKKRRRPFG